MALVFLAQVAGVACAAARVEAMQMPAWLERGGARMAVLPGLEVAADDILVTGKDGRLLIRLDGRFGINRPWVSPD